MEALAPVVMSTMVRLGRETGSLQRRIEHELELFGAGASWLDYRMYLVRMFGFHAPVERALGAVPDLEDVVVDAGLRNNKVALLAHDLVSLGVDRRDLVAMPRMVVPALDDLPEALGWMYVLEASTLDSRDLSRHLAQHLPAELASASAYLGCYGAEVHARWADFGEALDDYAMESGHGDRIVAAATECLVRLHRWLRPPAPAPVVAARLHA